MYKFVNVDAVTLVMRYTVHLTLIEICTSDKQKEKLTDNLTTYY